MSVERRRNRWKFLTTHSIPILYHNQITSKQKNNEEDIDPFSCEDVFLPSSKAIIEEVIETATSEWEALDDRRISNASEEHVPKRVRRSRSRISLPLNFDYETQSSSLPSDENENDEKVLCLTDPSVHLSYSSELWKIFASVPTEEEIKIPRIIPHVSALKKEIEEAIKEYTRVDCHALSRLRMRSLNHFPSDGEGDIVRVECWNRMLKRGSSPDSHSKII